jgi:uncharacterized protein DUF4440
MKSKTVVWVSMLMVTLACAATLKKAAAADDAVAAVTKLENDAVKADLAGDKSFSEKNLASDWTGGDSSGEFFTKADVLKMLDDAKNNKTNSEKISDLKVRSYGDAAVATYRDTYDAMVQGEHRVRTVISTDTFVKQGGAWKQVASHASTSK